MSTATNNRRTSNPTRRGKANRTAHPTDPSPPAGGKSTTPPPKSTLKTPNKQPGEAHSTKLPPVKPAISTSAGAKTQHVSQQSISGKGKEKETRPAAVKKPGQPHSTTNQSAVKSTTEPVTGTQNERSGHEQGNGNTPADNQSGQSSSTKSRPKKGPAQRRRERKAAAIAKIAAQDEKKKEDEIKMKEREARKQQRKEQTKGLSVTFAGDVTRRIFRQQDPATTRVVEEQGPLPDIESSGS